MSKRSLPEPERSLRHRLRAGDPASAGPLPAPEAERMRRRLLATAAAAPERAAWGRPLLAGLTAAAALALVVVWSGQRSSPDPVTRTGALTVAQGTPDGAEAGRPARDIRFVTAGGTQVVWRLDPRFDP